MRFYCVLIQIFRMAYSDLYADLFDSYNPVSFDLE